MRKTTTALALLLLAQSCSGREDGEREFNPRQVVPPIRAITDAPISKPTELQNDLIDIDLVLGVVVGKSARAYPINMLTGPQREIINDKLGGRAIAATW